MLLSGVFTHQLPFGQDVPSHRFQQLVLARASVQVEKGIQGMQTAVGKLGPGRYSLWQAASFGRQVIEHPVKPNLNDHCFGIQVLHDERKTLGLHFTFHV
jgi:hypothetical protein